MRIVIDSNAYNALAGRPEVVAAVTEGRLTLVTTHVQEDENNRAPEEVRALLDQVPVTEKVPTAGAVWDVSRWDQATWAGPDTAEVIETAMKGNARHAEDALILATALREGLPIVTHDKALTTSAARRGVEVFTPERLLALLT